MNMREKLENFWYHYKYTVLIGGVFVLFAVISIGQMIFKKSPDANFLYMGTASIGYTSEDRLQSSIAKVMKEDYNNDGRKCVDYLELTVLDPEKAADFSNTTYTSKQVHEASLQRFSLELSSGKSMVYLTDEVYYKTAFENDLLIPLSDITSSVPKNAHDEYSIYLKDLDIYYLPGFNELPPDTLLYLRYPTSFAESDKKEKKRAECNTAVFRDMLEYVHPDKSDKQDESITEMSDEEFLTLFNSWCEKYNVEKKEEVKFTRLSNADFFEKSHAALFRCDNNTFVGYDSQIYSLGRSSNGFGVVDVELCDFDENGIFDLIFTYNYTDNTQKNSASVFNLKTLRENPLSLEKFSKEGTVMILKKSSDTLFDIMTVNCDENGTPLSQSGEVVAQILSQNSSIAKKTYE